MLYLVYRDQHILRPIVVLTDHTRLDQALEACVDERTQMLGIELVENTPHLIVAGDRAPDSIDAAQIIELQFGPLFEIEQGKGFK